MSTQDDIDTRIVNAEIEVSLAIGVLKWAETIIPSGWAETIIPSEWAHTQFLKDHISQRVRGLEDALITLKRIKEASYEAKRNGGNDRR